MNKFLSFFKSTSPLLLLLLGVGIEFLSKLIEKRFTSLALGLQLLAFIVIVYSLIRLLNRSRKTSSK
jgi:sulfite exporter TauE/SafE